jgi:hypothetical protein
VRWRRPGRLRRSHDPGASDRPLASHPVGRAVSDSRRAPVEKICFENRLRVLSDLGTVVQGVWSKRAVSCSRGSSDSDRSTRGKSASCGPPDNARQPTACY